MDVKIMGYIAFVLVWVIIFFSSFMKDDLVEFLVKVYVSMVYISLIYIINIKLLIIPVIVLIFYNIHEIEKRLYNKNNNINFIIYYLRKYIIKDEIDLNLELIKMKSKYNK